MLIDCEGVSRTADWYVEHILATMEKSPGGQDSCFHVCIDAGTTGVHCSNPSKIQDLLRATGCTWVSVTVCQFHQGNLLCKAVFDIDEYATATKRRAVVYI